MNLETFNARIKSPKDSAEIFFYKNLHMKKKRYIKDITLTNFLCTNADEGKIGSQTRFSVENWTPVYKRTKKTE